MAAKLSEISIEKEMKRSYLDYAMSVIIGRAIPDIKDGLKPVQRRALYSMHELGLKWNKPFKKSARIVGDIIGKYHPHGDTAAYDTIVRMAQDFALRYPLVDGQGNFGSVDGDPAAAMRYTEVRMQKIAKELMADLDKDTVNFVSNYDGSLTMPEVLPAKFPNLLVNGGSGIAVGMATNIPPHNIGEVIDGVIHLIRNPKASLKDIMKFIPGPDFPTGGFIFGKDGIKSAYETGKGVIYIRAKAVIESGAKGERARIVITEIPFQVNKANLLEKMAKLVNAKKIEGIADIRDESSREGIRVVIEIKRGESPEIVLNNLYKHTSLQTFFGIILLAIVDRQPKQLGLLDVMRYFISHRRDVVRRRTRHELKNAKLRAHILEGLTIALDNLDDVIALIRGSSNVEEARKGLITTYHMTKTQAQAILDLQLQKLTQLEREKIQKEYEELLKLIKKLKRILGSEELILNIIVEELEKIKKEYNDQRKTEVIDDDIVDLKPEDLIKEEDVAIAFTASGYIKRTPLSSYRFQCRGGKGKRGMSMKAEDIVENLFICSTHNYLLVFTNKGHMYWLKALDIPDLPASSKGKSINNLIDFSSGERVSSLVAVEEFSEDKYVVMLASDGIIKKTRLSLFRHIRKGGIRAVSLKGKAELLMARITDGKRDIIIGTRSGKAIKFHEKEIRPMGRQAAGVKGINLSSKDRIIGMVVVTKEDKFIFTASEHGYGKKTEVSLYPRKHRGGKGVINLKTPKKIGKAVGMIGVSDEEALLITKLGKTIRVKTEDFRPIGRATQGVKLIDVDKSDRAVSLAKVCES
ncbi:MAG: DNA gyrase subunit A [Candidatus Aminicenantes bacterium]|nr:DNA gyrase subunit A [Candidatus Aminicenantes bacterium]